MHTASLAFVTLWTIISFAQTPPNIPKNFPRDYRGIIHCHSRLSHDSKGKLIDIERAARERGVDFIIMTDHFSLGLYEKSPKGIIGNTLFIVGAELSRKNKSSILVFPLPKDFSPEKDWQKNVEKLKELGATVFLGHMELADDNELPPFDGLEIANFHALALRGGKIALPLRYLQAIPPHNWDLRFLIPRNLEGIDRWYKLEATKGNIVPAIAGNDTHDNYRLFQKFGPKLGSYNRTFKAITTHVWATELSETAIIEAIKSGRSYFAFEVFGKTNGFRFYLTNGKELWLPGSAAGMQDGLKLVVILPANSKKTWIRIVKDGSLHYQTFRSCPEKGAIRFQMPVKTPGIYHVEITKNGQPWIFSNAILIR